MLAILFLVTGGALLAVAALHDVAARTVPNPLAAAVAVAGLLAQALLGNLLYAVPAAAAVFVCAALCWRRGWMGGGDVKLLGAAALLVPPAFVPMLVAATGLSGGLLALPYLLARHRLPRPAPRTSPRTPGDARPLLPRAWRAERWRLRRGGPMPYAVAIASGALFVFTHGGLP